MGAIVASALYWVFGFLRMGTTGLAAQARGAGDRDEVNALLMRVLLLGGAAGVAIILAQLPLMALAFRLSPASAEVEALARDYLSIRFLSAPATIALYGITGWLIAAERTRAVLVLQLWMNGANILLDLWFVLGLSWGVAGVATATVTAEWSGLLLGLWLCRGGLRGGAWRAWSRVFDGARLMRMMAVNGDILIRSVLLQGAFMAFLFLGAGLGDVVLAANQVLLQFLHVTAYALDGFAFAAEALVGQAMGARARPVLRRAALISSLWAGAAVVVLAAAFALAGGAIIDVMTRDPQVQATARGYLGWMVAAPVLGVGSWMLDGVFIGATRTRDMRNAMVVSTLIYAAALAWLLPAFGNHGLWAGLMVFFAARAVTLALRYPALERAATPEGAVSRP